MRRSTKTFGVSKNTCGYHDVTSDWLLDRCTANQAGNPVCQLEPPHALLLAAPHDRRRPARPRPNGFACSEDIQQ
jgi:hypothetical protein